MMTKSTNVLLLFGTILFGLPKERWGIGLSDPISDAMGFREEGSYGIKETAAQQTRFSSLRNRLRSQSTVSGKDPQCGDEGGQTPVVVGGGCCPIEGFKDGQECNGHGICRVDPVPPPNITASKPKSKPAKKTSRKPTAPKMAAGAKKLIIQLTRKEQEQSLGEKYQLYIKTVQQTQKDVACNVELYKQTSVIECASGLTYGCVNRPGESKMYTKYGCKGSFRMKGSTWAPITCESGSDVITECDILQGFNCRKGRGQKKMSRVAGFYNFGQLTGYPVISEIMAPSIIDCAKKCGETEGCVGIEFAHGLNTKKKVKNCGLFFPNTPRIGLEDRDGGLWQYCEMPPAARFKACGDKGICAMCSCEPGWGGPGCGDDLSKGSDPVGCSPLDESCTPKLPTPEPPCFGQPEEFAEDDPCRDIFREHVPNPPEAPPETPDYKTSQTPSAWVNPAAGSEA